MSEARNKRRRLKVVAEKQMAQAMAQRPCNGCTACCTTLGVKEIGKKKDEACVHANGGCSIYATRPPSCRTFQCLWRIGMGTVDERPDKVGIVLDVTGPSNVVAAIVAHEVTPGAFERGEVFLQRLVSEGHLIFLVSGNERRRVIGPPEKLAKIKGHLQVLEQE